MARFDLDHWINKVLGLEPSLKVIEKMEAELKDIRTSNDALVSRLKPMAERNGILQHICMCMSDEEDEQAGYLVRGAFSDVVNEIETLRLASCAPGNTVASFAHWSVSNGEVVAVDFGASVSVHLCVNGDYNGGNVASPVLRAWWEMIGCYFGERANWDNESMIQGYLPDGVCVDLGDTDE